jgi:hypothetical protein
MIKQMKLDAKKNKANKKPARGTVELGSSDGTLLDVVKKYGKTDDALKYVVENLIIEFGGTTMEHQFAIEDFACSVEVTFKNCIFKNTNGLGSFPIVIAIGRYARGIAGVCEVRFENCLFDARTYINTGSNIRFERIRGTDLPYIKSLTCVALRTNLGCTLSNVKCTERKAVGSISLDGFERVHVEKCSKYDIPRGSSNWSINGASSVHIIACREYDTQGNKSDICDIDELSINDCGNQMHLTIDNASVGFLRVGGGSIGPVNIGQSHIAKLLIYDATVDAIYSTKSTIERMEANNSVCRETPSWGPTYVKAIDSVGFGEQSGHYILYKKCRLTNWYSMAEKNAVIVELLVSPNTKFRSEPHNLTERKVRVARAKVINMYIFDPTGQQFVPYVPKWYERVRSKYDPRFTYSIGKVVRPKNGFDDSPVACGGGIHGLRSMAEADEYWI